MEHEPVQKEKVSVKEEAGALIARLGGYEFTFRKINGNTYGITAEGSYKEKEIDELNKKGVEQEEARQAAIAEMRRREYEVAA